MRGTVLALCLVLGTACRHVPRDASAPEGYVTAGQSTLWTTRALSVCWEEPADGDAAARSAVQDAVVRAYGAADFAFTGWGDCAAGPANVHVAVRDTVPQVAAYGAWLDGRAAGVVLNFTFEHGGDPACRSEALRKACWRSYAVHEFGHVLGLRHEANRPDTRCPAQDQTGGLGEAGALSVDLFDLDSVMNYCRLNHDLELGTPSALSAGDVQTLTKYYGGEVPFPGQDLGAHCAADGGAWDSVQTCCDLGAAVWQPSLPVAYRACALPPAATQATACGLARGSWDEAGACCRGAAPAGVLAKWRTLYAQCL